MVDSFGGWHPDYPGQRPQDDPQFQRLYGQQQQAAQQQQQQPSPAMTRPTIHAEIIVVSNGELGEQDVDRYPVGIGQPQMFIAQDESVIYVKEGTQNGPILDVYPRRPRTPTPPPFDPSDYLRRDEAASWIAEAVAAAMPARQARTPKKETEAAE